MDFKLFTGNPKDFFKLLPKDWQDNIIPLWPKYAKEKWIYTIMHQGKIVAGGIVAKGLPADMIQFKAELTEFVENNALYLGYIWVVPEMRNKKLGTQWLSGVKNTFPNHTLWLSIEEAGLANFYLPHDFTSVKRLDKGGETEWVLQYRPKGR